MALLPTQVEGTIGSNRVTELLNGVLRGGECVGYESIDVDETAAEGLTIPGGASQALIAIEASSTATNPDRVVRWRADGTSPTTAEGMPLGDNGSLLVKNTTDLGNIEFIGIEAGKTHKVRVSYYS